MSPQAEERFHILAMLSRYEAAYKNALRFARVNTSDNVADLQGPLYDLVKYYKNKIRSLKERLRKI